MKPAPEFRLRRRVFRGSLFLAGRQIVGSGISFVGVLFLVRLIGPAAYGAFAAASAIFAYLYAVGPLGIQTYLVWREGELDPADYDQAFTLLLLIGMGLLVPALLCALFLGSWIGSGDIRSVALIVFSLLPVTLCSLVPMAKLERDLDYKAVASVELTGQVAFYALALLGAVEGYGAYAAAAGFVAQDLSFATLMFYRARYRPRLTWEWRRIAEMLRYGVGYASTIWILQLGTLVNPLIVGRFAGAEAVGVVAFTVRMLDNLSFAKTAAGRVSIAAMSKVQSEPRRIARAVGDGARLQLITFGPILLAFSFLAPYALPRLFGKDWAPVLALLPYLGAAYLFATAVNLHASALYVLKRNGQMAICNGVRTALLFIAAGFFVPLAGSVGYGWAEGVASLSYLVLYRYSWAAIGATAAVETLATALAFALAMFWPQIGPAAALGFIALVASPKAPALLRFYLNSLRELRHG